MERKGRFTLFKAVVKEHIQGFLRKLQFECYVFVIKRTWLTFQLHSHTLIF